MVVPTITLADGTPVPQVAFGVGALSKKDFDQAFLDKINQAIKLGYRHFDGAQIYKSDQELGVALSECGIPREEFYLTNKVHPSAGIKDRDIEGGLRKQLVDLKTSYVDLYLIHNPFWPEGSKSVEEVWRDMEALVEKGLTKHIGVSNFEPVDLEKVLKIAKIKPVVNQIELHPYIFKESQPIVDLCKKENITIAAYSPLMPIARHPDGPLPPLIDSIAKKHGVTPAQVLLKLQADQGRILVTSSGNAERAANQLQLDGFTLDSEDVTGIEEEGAKYSHRFFGWGAFHKEYVSVL